MTNAHSNIYTHEQLRAAHALLKFCIEHNYKSEHLRKIETCICALETQNIQVAIDCYLGVPLGGNGCFNDWWPPVVYEHETEEYVWAIFEALLSQWSRLMQLSIPVVRP